MSDELRARDLLASHVAPPPPVGLEARILDRTVRRSRARLGFAVPAAVAIAALVAGALLVAPALGLLRGPSGAPPAAPAAPPVAWRGAGVAYDAGAHYILAFGGDDGHGAALDSTWAWTPAGWHELTPATRPPARRDARLAYDRGRGQLLLFGGTDGAGRPLDDTWAWTGLTWRRAGTAVSPPWAGDLTAMAFDPAYGQLMLVSAAPGDSTLSTWSWGGDGWNRMGAAVGNPLALGYARMAEDTRGQRVVLYASSTAAVGGGRTWVWTQGGWRADPVNAGPPGDASLVSAAVGGVVAFDASGVAWTYGTAGWTAAGGAGDYPPLCVCDAPYPAAGVVLHAGDGTWTWAAGRWTRR